MHANIIFTPGHKGGDKNPFHFKENIIVFVVSCLFRFALIHCMTVALRGQSCWGQFNNYVSECVIDMLSA